MPPSARPRVTAVTPFHCQRCGHCCRTLIDAYNGVVSAADLKRWRRAGRSDLLARVETLELGPGNRLHLAWRDPLSGEEVERCPWLVEGADGCACAIEAIKPDHCRAYPEHRGHAEGTGCPGYRKEEDSDASSE